MSTSSNKEPEFYWQIEDRTKRCEALVPPMKVLREDRTCYDFPYSWFEIKLQHEVLGALRQEGYYAWNDDSDKMRALIYNCFSVEKGYLVEPDAHNPHVVHIRDITKVRDNKKDDTKNKSNGLFSSLRKTNTKKKSNKN